MVDNSFLHHHLFISLWNSPINSLIPTQILGADNQGGRRSRGADADNQGGRRFRGADVVDQVILKHKKTSLQVYVNSPSYFSFRVTGGNLALPG